MEKIIPSGLKTTFLVHMIVGGIFGLLYLLAPEMFGGLINWPVKDPFVTRMLGAALLGIAASSWFAYKASSWGQIKIVVQMEVIWTILATLITLGGLLMAGVPAFGWVNAVILACFAAAFTYFYVKS